MPIDYEDFYTPIKTGYMQRLRYCLKDDFLLKSGEGVGELPYRVSDNEANIQRGADYLIVCKPGTFSEVQGQSYNSKEWQTMDWVIRTELYVRFIEAAEQWSRFDPFRSAVIFHTMQRRFLKTETIEGVAMAEVAGVEMIRSIVPQGEASYYRFMNTSPLMNPNFMFQSLAITIRQRVRFP